MAIDTANEIPIAKFHTSSHLENMTDRLPPTPKYSNAELERLIASRGGFFWLEGEHEPWVVELLETIVARFNQHVVYAKMEFYKEKSREIIFGFTCDSSLNAFAYASPSTDPVPFDFIGINIGVVFTLLETFSRILANKKSFPEVGSPNIENDDHKIIPFLSTDVMRSGFQPISPNCPIRSFYVGELFKVALDFLFFHELTHLKNGHLEYVRGHSSLTAWTEVVSDCLESTEQKLRQALEIDADAGATLLTVNIAFRFKEKFLRSRNSMPPEMVAAINSAYGSSVCAARTVGYACYSIFRLFDSPEVRWEDQENYRHPFPPIRMHLTGATMFEIFKNRPGYDYNCENFISDYSVTVRNVELDFSYIQGKPVCAAAIMSVVNSRQSIKYIEEFNKTWSYLRPILDRYKRGGKLA